MLIYCLLSTLLLMSGFTAIESSSLHPRLPAWNKISRAKSPELDETFWQNKAQDYIIEKLYYQKNLNTNRAKNIIIFLGDGMSVHTITAARSYTDDTSNRLSFENFPYVGLSKTYCVDKQVPDSASTSTAYLSGVKANYGTIGVTAQVPRYDCNLGQNTNYHTESIAKWAQDAGKWAGLVTTARVTHASPAGVYAHVANREWEHDGLIKVNGCDSKANVDIARQLVEWPVGKDLRVVMGGGRRNFISEDNFDETGVPGNRTDGRNLIDEWLADKETQGSQAKYVWNKKNLNAANLKKTDYLLGLFSSSHCPYHGDLEREDLTDDIPSLSEMTEAAIELLSRSEKGYFLFVEGAKIDMAHHDNRARRSLEDTVEFAKALDVARTMTSEDDTLIVLTSDHSHTMTISGYPYRDEDILGLNSELADDNLPYNILSYANGPGYEKTYGKKGRKDLTDKDFTNPKRKYMATVPLESETHGGEDVAIFASGPYAHYFSGNYEQTNIPMLMSMAAQIGPFASSSRSDSNESQ